MTERYCTPRLILSRSRLNIDVGSRYTVVRFWETLAIEGMRPSMCFVGDDFDNALAETTIGLKNTEGVR